MADTKRSLSKTEAKVILELEWRGQPIITTAELRSMIGASEGYARFVVHRLVHKGWLERVRPGLFQLVPAERGPDGVSDTNPLTLGSLLVAPYFFSFGTACTHHGLTEQVFSEVYIACRSARRPRVVRDTRYVFVALSERRFFGFEEVDVLGAKIRMATRERAVLDALDRPRYAGGISEVSRIVAKASPTLSWEALLDLATRWNESAIIQRLGYFLDMHHADVPAHVRTGLRELVAPRNKVHLGSRGDWGTTGRVVQPWNIVENVPHERLFDAERDRRLRRTFPRRPA